MGRKSSINKVKRSNVASKNIEACLIMSLYEKGHSPITSHFSGHGMGECDVLSISKSDFIYEYEVKISRADFKKDFKKDKHRLITEKKFTIDRKITENNIIITDPLILVANYFYFVTPTNLVTADEVPTYAGLMYMNEKGLFEVIKKAPFIHKTKATSSFIRTLSHQLTCKLVFNKVM